MRAKQSLVPLKWRETEVMMLKLLGFEVGSSPPVVMKDDPVCLTSMYFLLHECVKMPN